MREDESYRLLIGAIDNLDFNELGLLPTPFELALEEVPRRQGNKEYFFHTAVINTSGNINKMVKITHT